MVVIIRLFMVFMVSSQKLYTIYISFIVFALACEQVKKYEYMNNSVVARVSAV